MLSSNSPGPSDPAWLQNSPKDSRRNSMISSYDDDGFDDDGGSPSRNNGRTKRGLSKSIKGGRRTKYGYVSDDEDENENDMEDCCCCPMDPVLFGMTIFHSISGILGIAAFAANIYHLTSPEEHGMYQDILQHSYCCIFCIIVIICEVDWRWIMKRFRILDLWLFRGLFYIYVGLETSDRMDDLQPLNLLSVCNIIGIALIVSGVMYFIMSLCCIKSIAEAKRRKQILSRYRDIDNDSAIESV